MCVNYFAAKMVSICDTSTFQMEVWTRWYAAFYLKSKCNSKMLLPKIKRVPIRKASIIASFCSSQSQNMFLFLTAQNLSNKEVVSESKFWILCFCSNLKRLINVIVLSPVLERIFKSVFCVANTWLEFRLKH